MTLRFDLLNVTSSSVCLLLFVLGDVGATDLLLHPIKIRVKVLALVWGVKLSWESTCVAAPSAPSGWKTHRNAHVRIDSNK